MLRFDRRLKNYLLVIDHGTISHWKAIKIDRYSFERLFFEFMCAGDSAHAYTKTYFDMKMW